MSKSFKNRPAWNKGIPVTEETKKKISQTLTGFHHSDETKKKMSKTRKGKAPLTKEQYQIIGQKQKGKTKNFGIKKEEYTKKQKKIIEILNLENNEILLVRGNEDASNITNIHKCTISEICRGDRKNLKRRKYYFRYV